jgi:hypothetical protein
VNKNAPKGAVYIIQSYPQLSNLFWLKSNNKVALKRVIVIGNTLLYSFLDRYSDIETSYIQDNNFSYYKVWDWIRLRAYSRSAPLVVNDCETVYFSSYEFAGIIGPVLKVCGRLGLDIIHLADPGCDVYTSKKRNLKSFESLLKSYVDKYIYLNTLEFAEFTPKLNREYVRRLSQRLIDRNRIIICQQSLEEVKNIGVPQSMLYTEAYEQCKVIIVLKDVVNSGIVDKNGYKTNWQRILNCLVKEYGHNEIFIKPRQNDFSQIDKDLFSKFKFVPIEVPFEHIKLKENVKVLGFTSTAMVSVRLVSICLYGFFDIKDKKKVERSLRIMEKRAGKPVALVSSSEELLAMLRFG